MSNKRRRRPAETHDNLEDININEVTDSEDDYTEAEKKLIAKARTKRSTENYDSDDEVYGLHDKDDSDENDMLEEDDEEEADSMESDIEGLQEDLDLPDERAWGKKKRDYYSTDYVDQDYASTSQKELADAEMEEEEAKHIQKRLAEQLDDTDFGLEFVKSRNEEDDRSLTNAEELIKTDLSKLSKRQKQAIMQKESPEFVALVNDFKDRMTEARDVLAPFLNMLGKHATPDCRAYSFVKTKYQLLLNYCVNISFYLMLKAKRLPVNSHPVIRRLAQYRELLNQLESGQGNIIEEIRELLLAEKEGKPIYKTCDGSDVSVGRKKGALCNIGNKLTRRKHLKEENSAVATIESKTDIDDSIDEDDPDHAENDEIENKEDFGEDAIATAAVDDNSAYGVDGKRAITYQIAKNKGLTPHRKKEQRNPRVKHRNKYRKAKIRRKGAVREVRKETTRYAGEISGIKASVKKSVKIK